MRATSVALAAILLAVAIQYLIQARSLNTQTRNAAWQDRPLPAHQAQLLELAFDAATAIPTQPHIKDRSRQQAQVVEACLKLDQPQRALRYIKQIENWRRGVAFADLALHHARHEDRTRALAYLDLAAESIADTEDWRRDRIKVRIAAVHAWLGRNESAQRLTAGVEASETGKLTAVHAAVKSADTFENQMRSLDEFISQGNFDVTQNILAAYVRLFDRVYDDPERRDRVELKIRDAWKKMPVLFRIELLFQMIDAAVDHNDSTHALKLVNDAGTLLDTHRWPLRYHIPLIARIAAHRFKAADRQTARAELEAALKLYDAQRQALVDIDRAAVMRSIAEAWIAMNDHDRALTAYARAVEEGVANPNSRPRAEDLSATCLSMALAAVRPDDRLLNRIREIRAGLGAPW